MAIIIEQIAGDEYGDYFYPAISGVAQSHNFYPISYMKPEEGIAHLALGFGKTVVEGEKTLPPWGPTSWKRRTPNPEF